MRGFVYSVTNLVNGKVYVGCTKNPAATRWSQHVSRAKKGSLCPLHQAIRKYGKTTFKVEVVASVEGSYDDLLVAEIRQIEAHDCIAPKGYNLTKGGEGIDFSVPELRERHAAAILKRNADPKYQAALVEGCRKRSQDEEWVVNNLEAKRKLSSDPAFQQKALEAGHSRALDPVWRTSNLVAMRKRAQDPVWLKANADRCRERSSNPSWVAATTVSLKKAHDALTAKALEKDAASLPEEKARREHQRAYNREYARTHPRPRKSAST
jgi:hypothetical protein